jgi:hypothetical protein
MRIPRLWFFCLLPLVQPAHAMVVASGGPNNTAPVGQPYFDNVGEVNGSTAVYLGNGWVLSANHVASSLPASATFGGVGYGTEAGSFHRLHNPAYSPTLSVFTDIVLFRLSAPLGLPDVDISTATPTVGSQVMMIGNGRTQFASPTYWNRTVISGPNNDTWVETTEELSNISGYQTTAAQEVRWGENQVDENGFTVKIGQSDVISFSTQFDEFGLTHEAQAVALDSGGGVFSYNDSSWELSGMIFAVSGYETQPGGSNTAVFGVQTAIADLSYYREEILSIIPEPATGALGLLGALMLLRRRR